MAAPLNPFAIAAQHAVADALEMPADRFVVGKPPKPELGDLAVGCFPAAKERKAAPAALAKTVVEAFAATELLAEASAAGPFVNFKINKSALFAHLANTALGIEELVPKETGAGKTICIDFSSPNISKQLAYHHIRSTVIGHALAKLYRAVGYTVVGINHLGDWGTTHGMLLAAYHKWPPEGEITIDVLNELYKKFREAIDDDASVADEGRAWFAKLEAGDKDARLLWQHFKDVSWNEFSSAYDMLGIEFDEVKGESEYLEDMPKVLELLEERHLSSTSEGALVVDLKDEGIEAPLLLRKQDGATLYGTRDLAAAMYRWDRYKFERNLYVVDRGQGLHFKQIFLTLKKAGFDWAERCQHVPFGLVRVGGKKTSSRGRNAVLLKEVFAEATERAAARIRESNGEWDDARVNDTASTVGIGAIVFANLMSQRDKDVDFDWDDVLSTSGDSGAYVQYGHARCCRVLRKAAGQGDSVENLASADFNKLRTNLEWALALSLTQLGDVVARSADSNDPHLLSRYLLDLVAHFSSWFTAGNQDKSQRVLCEDDATRHARLALVAMTREVLREGLALLGVGAPDSM